MLEPPHYLLASSTQTAEIRFAWDDWNTESVEDLPDERLVAELGRISDRAIVALATGMAEWTIYRFEPLNDDRLPWQLLEAAWAAEVDWRYLAETWQSFTEDGSGWTGPVRGALNATMFGVDEVFYAAMRGENVTDGARWLSNIAVHVLPHAEVFLRWRSLALKRLAVLYPRDPDDLIGDVVPRQVLDPAIEFRIEDTESLINRFLRFLDPSQNPFLSSPANLLQSGFTGVPYVFNLGEDREGRFFK